MTISQATDRGALVQELSQAGAQFGFSRSRRHPSTAAYIFGFKNRVEIVDLEKSAIMLQAAEEFLTELGHKREQILFVGVKPEAVGSICEAAQKLGMPYAKERWLGGMLTNWFEMKKRIARLLDLVNKRDANEFGVYTKKERLLIDREIAHLERFFGGFIGMTKLPSALVIVDPREEKTALREAQALRIPVVALAGTDCDIEGIQYPIVANDSSRSSIGAIVCKLTSAYERGLAMPAIGAAAIETPPEVETLASTAVLSQSAE